MTINESALKELLGHLVFTHSFRSFDAKQAAEKALERLIEPGENKAPTPPGAEQGSGTPYPPGIVLNKAPESPVPPVLP